MATRLIDDQYWLERFVRRQSAYGKLLYFYCMYQPDSNPHGIITATPEDIELDTAIPRETILDLLESFNAQGKIKWIEYKDKIWVKDFILTQTKNPSYFKRVNEFLQKELPEFTALVEEYISYYNNMGFWDAHYVNITKTSIDPKIAPREEPS